MRDTIAAWPPSKNKTAANSPVSWPPANSPSSGLLKTVPPRCKMTAVLSQTRRCPGVRGPKPEQEREADRARHSAASILCAARELHRKATMKRMFSIRKTPKITTLTSGPNVLWALDVVLCFPVVCYLGTRALPSHPCMSAGSSHKAPTSSSLFTCSWCLLGSVG